MKGKIIYVDFSKKYKTNFLMFWLYRIPNIIINKFKSVHDYNENTTPAPNKVKQLFNE